MPPSATPTSPTWAATQLLPGASPMRPRPIQGGRASAYRMLQLLVWTVRTVSTRWALRCRTALHGRSASMRSNPASSCKRAVVAQDQLLSAPCFMHFAETHRPCKRRKTAQSRVLSNVFFNGPRAGINMNDGFGGGDEIAYNLVFSTCRESGDHGPFNSWDRQPFLTTVRTGKPSMIMQWREIHHNFFIDNYSPQEDVDNDDGSCYYKTHDNFLVYGGQAMKNDFGGHDNHHYNNVDAYVGRGLGVCETLPGHDDYFYGSLAASAVQVLSSCATCGPDSIDEATMW